ncbi:MAG: hypothetical protein ACXV3U_04750 [Halobacteriota archaeon]
MNVVYFSHSYNDPEVSNYFGSLIQSEDLRLSLDPPSKTFNSAKLTRHLASCDGMVAILSKIAKTEIHSADPSLTDDNIAFYIAAMDAESKFLISRGVTHLPQKEPRGAVHISRKQLTVEKYRSTDDKGGFATIDGVNVGVVTLDYVKQNNIPVANEASQKLDENHDISMCVLIDDVVKGLIFVDFSISSYIRFEISHCLKAQKPVVAFVEDTLDDNIIPSTVLQMRFSRRSLIRQTREHRHALEILKSYMGGGCPPRYQPFLRQKMSLLVGFERQDASFTNNIIQLLRGRGYVTINIDEKSNLSYSVDTGLSRPTLTIHDVLTSADLAICFLDKELPRSQYLIGAINWASVPIIPLSNDAEQKCLPDAPIDFSVPNSTKVKQIDPTKWSDTRRVIEEELNAFEEDFLEIDDEAKVKNYVNALIDVSSQGKYSNETRASVVNNVYGIQAGGDVKLNNVRGVAIGSGITQIQEAFTITQKEDLKENLKAFQQKIASSALPEEDVDIAKGYLAAAIKEVKKEKADPSLINRDFRGAIDTISGAGNDAIHILESTATQNIIRILNLALR